MVFHVNTTGLAGLPAQLDRLEQDARAGSSYVTTYTHLSYGGLLNSITGSHEHAVGTVRDRARAACAHPAQACVIAHCRRAGRRIQACALVFQGRSINERSFLNRESSHRSDLSPTGAERWRRV